MSLIWFAHSEARKVLPTDSEIAERWESKGKGKAVKTEAEGRKWLDRHAVESTEEIVEKKQAVKASREE